MSRTIISVNIGLRGAMEAAFVAALAAAGYAIGTSTAARMTLAAVLPLVGFGIWGVIDFHQVPRFGESLRLGEELLLVGAAASACFERGPAALAWVLIALTAVHHTLRLTTGRPLLGRTTAGRSARAADHRRPGTAAHSAAVGNELAQAGR